MIPKLIEKEKSINAEGAFTNVLFSFLFKTNDEDFYSVNFNYMLSAKECSEYVTVKSRLSEINECIKKAENEASDGFMAAVITLENFTLLRDTKSFKKRLVILNKIKDEWIEKMETINSKKVDNKVEIQLSKRHVSIKRKIRGRDWDEICKNKPLEDDVFAPLESSYSEVVKIEDLFNSRSFAYKYQIKALEEITKKLIRPTLKKHTSLYKAVSF